MIWMKRVGQNPEADRLRGFAYLDRERGGPMGEDDPHFSEPRQKELAWLIPSGFILSNRLFGGALTAFFI